jgi:diguanylate cyclase (GGDEF)-like protein
VRGYLCFFDLDRFKQINDELGHAKGDDALKEFAATLRSVFRKDALLVRLGGDEFVAMGVEQQAGQIGETLKALEGVLLARNTQGTTGFKLESSAGVTYFDKNGPHSLEELTAAADAELYKNKETRRYARKQQGGAVLEPHEDRP